MRLSTSICFLLIGFISCKSSSETTTTTDPFNTDVIVKLADNYLTESPVTITSFIAERSKGGLHDYYSEGPYWWPDSTNIDGPYIRRDGIRNPNNFNGHRSSLKQFEDKVVALTSAYLITKNKVYAQKAEEHLRAWFVDEATFMNPQVEYGQAIKGIVDGRGIGIIDFIGLIDVSNAISLLIKNKALSQDSEIKVKAWFEQLSTWYMESNHGKEEANNNNNHSTWWGAQLSAFANLTQNKNHRKVAQEQFKNQLVIQMLSDGSLPEELERTKPFHYMNYAVEGWVEFALLLSDEEHNFWEYQGKTGSIKKMTDFAYNHHNSIDNWPYKSDLETTVTPEQEDYFLFASKALNEPRYKEIWLKFSHSNQENHSRLFLYQQLYNLL